MTNLSILSKEIRILDGLYSLNDLHKASGYSNKHRPSLFMKNQQTQELIHEIEQSRNSCFGENNQSENSHFDKNRDLGIPRSVKTQRGGAYSGTWVCKELVYSYAMWISPKFHLQVIRAFDAMVNQEPQLLPHQVLQLSYQQHEPKDYNYPLRTADPSTRNFANANLTYDVILNERRPEWELIQQLEKDGYDVTGAKVRLESMYDLLTWYRDYQRELEDLAFRVGRVANSMHHQTEKRGKNVLFERNGMPL